MAQVVNKLVAYLFADTSNYEQSFQKAGTTTQQFERSFNRSMQSLDQSVKTSVQGLFGLKSILAGFFTAEFLHRSIEAGANLETLSRKTGVSVESLSKLELVAKTSGVSLESLGSAINKMQVNLSRAGDEGGKAAAALKLIGTSAAELKRLSTEDQLLKIANGIAQFGDQADRTRLLVDILGRSGAELGPLFEKGAPGIKAAMDQAERLGLVVSTERAQQLEEFNTKWEAFVLKCERLAQLSFLGVMNLLEKTSGRVASLIDPESVDTIDAANFAIRTLEQNKDKLASKITGAGLDEAELQLAYKRLYDINSQLDILYKKRAALTDTKSAPDAPKNKRLISTAGPPLPDSQLDKFTKSLTAQTDALGLSERALFVEKAALQAAAAAHEDFKNKLPGATELTIEQKQAIEDLAGRFYDLQKAQQLSERYNEEFKSSFEEAASSIITGSKSIGDALKDLIKSFAELILKQQILQPLADSIFGTRGSGGGVGGLAGGFGSLFSNSGQSGLPWQSFGSRNPAGGIYLGSFATGLDMVPRDGIAMVHKGESILNDNQASSWRAGSNGHTYYIDATGASDSKITELKALILTLAGPGRVEDRVRDARRRGQNI